MSEHTYDESKIKTLSSLEHIRKRPGMYIGRLGDGSHPDDGIYILLKEVLDNAVDEYIMGLVLVQLVSAPFTIRGKNTRQSKGRNAAHGRICSSTTGKDSTLKLGACRATGRG